MREKGEDDEEMPDSSEEEDSDDQEKQQDSVNPQSRGYTRDQGRMSTKVTEKQNLSDIEEDQET